MKYIEKIVKSKIICQTRESYYIDLPSKQVKPFFPSKEDCHVGVDQDGWKIVTFFMSPEKEDMLKALENFLNSEVILSYRHLESWSNFYFVIAGNAECSRTFSLPTTNNLGNIYDRFSLTWIKDEPISEEFKIVKEYFELNKELQNEAYFIKNINELPDSIFKILSVFVPTLCWGHCFKEGSIKFPR